MTWRAISSMTWRAKWHPYLACGFSNVAAPGPFGFVSEDVAGQRGDFDRVRLLGRRCRRVVAAQIATFESGSSYIIFKRSNPGAFNTGFIVSTRVQPPYRLVVEVLQIVRRVLRRVHRHGVEQLQALGPGRYCRPRHEMPCGSTNVTS